MSDENSSVVSIVGIIAILILVGFAIYFFMIRSGGDDADLEIDITGAVSEVVPDQQPPMSAGLSVLSLPG